MTDAIDPGHYKGFSNGAQVIDISENLTSNAGQAVQYIARSCRLDGANKGDQIEDLTKAAWFVNREVHRIAGVEAADPLIDDAYVLELAQHMAATVHPSMKWEEWTSGTPQSFQEGFIAEAWALIGKLKADGFIGGAS